MRRPRTKDDLRCELARLKPASRQLLRCVVKASLRNRDLETALLQLYLDRRIPTWALREACRWLEFAAVIL